MINLFKKFLRPFVVKTISLKKYITRMAAIRSASKVTKLVNSKNKGLFIDCGSNLGQGFAFFEQYFHLKMFDFILVEPNPHCEETLKNKITGKMKEGSIELIKKAASTSDGTTKFFGLVEDDRGKTSEGGSILKEATSAWYTHSEEEAITVETFSLSDLIKNKANNYKIIVIKMDIEGGEYEVLEDLLKHGPHKKISLIFTEFHSQYMKEPDKTAYRSREKVIVQSFKQDKIPFKNWV